MQQQLKRKPLVCIEESRIYEITKRLVDISGALFGIVFLSPLFLVISVAIVLENSGPILFKQSRIGKNGQEFYMYKFRSMVNNAEELLVSLKENNEADGPLFKMKNDPRVTKIGALLRKTSLDEFPQLINVLLGEMSLVGPRPALPIEIHEYESWHYQRLCVKQGMTGLWQVSGRSSLNFDDMVRLDIEYIKRRSLWYDISLILKTIPALLGSKDAY